jgi:hypothetical protein
MSRVTTGLAVGIPTGAAILAWSVVRDLTTGHEYPLAPSRTVPKQREPLFGPQPPARGFVPRAR